MTANPQELQTVSRLQVLVKSARPQSVIVAVGAESSATSLACRGVSASRRRSGHVHNRRRQVTVLSRKTA